MSAKPIITPRLELVPLSESLIASVIAYLNANKSFHSPYESIRPEGYYERDYWHQQLQQQVSQDFDAVGCKLFLRAKDTPNDVLGYVHASNIVRGAFQACHLGYMLAQDAQGQGYMSEALQAFINYLFKHQNLHRIQANYLIDNQRSAKLLQKLGFVIEGTAKQYLLIDGRWQDHTLTSLINTAWSA